MEIVKSSENPMPQPREPYEMPRPVGPSACDQQYLPIESKASDGDKLIGANPFGNPIQGDRSSENGRF